MFEVLCKQCTHNVVNCYNFVMTTKQTSELLSNAICSLTTCLENTTQPISNKKTLFVTMDPINMETTNYYHHKATKTLNIALKRFHSILHPKPKIKGEKKQQIPEAKESVKLEKKLKSKKQDLEDDKPRKRRPYFSVPMKTKEMLYNKTDRTTLKCKDCLKSFPFLPSLRNHYIGVHAPKKHECEVCHKKYASETLLEGHKKLSHCTVICSECGKIFHNRHTFKMHKIGHHLKIVCHDCGRVYKSQSSFKKHKDLQICGQITRASPANAQFTCDYCNKKYTQKVSLRVHIQYEHGNYKGHICKWCNKSFYAQSRLKAHIVKHTQEKNFPCNICGGRYITKESLLYHTRIHTGERPYKCDFCDSRFVSASRRSEHIKSRHSGATKSVYNLQ